MATKNTKLNPRVTPTNAAPQKLLAPDDRALSVAGGKRAQQQRRDQQNARVYPTNAAPQKLLAPDDRALSVAAGKKAGKEYRERRTAAMRKLVQGKYS